MAKKILVLVMAVAAFAIFTVDGRTTPMVMAVRKSTTADVETAFFRHRFPFYGGGPFGGFKGGVGAGFGGIPGGEGFESGGAFSGGAGGGGMGSIGTGPRGSSVGGENHVVRGGSGGGEGDFP